MKPMHPPIVQSTAYQYDSIHEMRSVMLSGEPLFYTRSGNPTVQSVAHELATLEGGESALLFSSGMAAICSSLLALLRSGDHIVAHKEIFSQTRALMDTILAKFGVQVSYVDFNEKDAVSNAINSNTKLLYLETPSNPTLDIVDLAFAGRIAKESALFLLVDSTIGTPALQKPLQYGASLVLHSATKYLAGHADVMSGAVIGSTDLVARIHAVQKLTGGVMDPHAAYLLGRGLKTLTLRVRQICDTALHLVRFLSHHPKVSGVQYPFWEDDPNSLIAHRQMLAGGGLISFELHGGLEAARKFVDGLKVIRLATSFGGTESTIEIPYELKKFRDETEETMGLVRLSVGIEDVGLLLNDLEQALKRANDE